MLCSDVSQIDIMPFIFFQKREKLIERRDNPEPVQAQNPRRRHWQQEWRQNQLSVSLSLGSILKAKSSL